MQAKRPIAAVGALLVALVIAGCSTMGWADIRPRTGPGTTSPDPQAYPDRVAAAYSQLYADATAPPLGEVPGSVNVVNLAFAAGTPLALVGPSPQGEEALLRDTRMLRAQGVRVVLSIGGADGSIDTSARQAVVDRVMAINERIPLDGIDWDIEQSAIVPDDIVAISSELVARRGPQFAVTLAPNGANIDAYLPIARELAARGQLTMISQQFYDAPVTTADALRQVQRIRDAGVPENNIGIGMMIGDSSEEWTIEECLDAVRTIRATFPGVRGGFLWETGRPGSGEWASEVAPVLTAPQSP